jgi:hypothetical protein
MPKRLFDVVAAAAFVVGLLFLAFIAGFFNGKNKYLFYPQLKAMEQTTRGLYNAYFDEPDYIAEGKPGTPAQSGARILDRSRVAPGATLVVGYSMEGFRAWLVDVDGKKLHEWHILFSQAFPKPEHLMWQARDTVIAWMGVHLFPNGDLLLNFQDNNFPFGSGLVRIDKDSKVVWKLPQNTHHDLVVEPDGTMWVPSLHYRPEGIPEFPNMAPWYYEDTVLKLSPTGEVLDEISVLKALQSHQGLMSITYARPTDVEAEDPLHVNGAEPLPAAWADRFPGLEAGDLLVSMRNVNAIAVIDPGTKQAKRVYTGPFIRQHDADYLPNGNFLLYDNLGGDPACGRTRLLELRPDDMSIIWKYDGCQDGGFRSVDRGMQDVLGNGNIITVDAHEGLVREVTHEPEPKLVWEYVNVIGERDGKPLVGMVTYAARIPEDQLGFLSR